MFTIEQIEKAAKQVGQELKYRKNRPVISPEMAEILPCPFCKDYVTWLDSSICQFLQSLPENLPNIEFALITRLGSESPAELFNKSPEIQNSLQKVDLVGDGLLVRTNTLGKSIFSEFDEVFFFKDKVSIPKPSDVSIVGPNKISQVAMDKLSPWMENTSCTMALGDGEGLNVIVRDRNLMRYL